jgi:hydroxymethylglutaryl-CoA reductase
MSLHAKQLAIAAGAEGDFVQRIVQRMIDEGNIRLERARQLVEELQQPKGETHGT